jgi:hypothetical protein
MNDAPKTFVRRWIRQNLGADSNILWPLFLYYLKTHLLFQRSPERYEPILDSYRISLDETSIIVGYHSLFYPSIAEKLFLLSYGSYVESRE